jgi:hypothetical protein
MPNIPYDSFFNLPSLDIGFVYQKIQDGETVLSYNIKNHSDIMTFGSSQLTGYGSDNNKS